MEEAMAARYWCHMCSQMVNPIMEAEIKCPFCQSGFIEEMDGSSQDNQETDLDIGSDRALSLWAPILLGMMGNPRRRRRFRHIEFGEDDDGNDGEANNVGETELDRELESILRRRRRSSATILQLLQGIRAGIAASESENSENGREADRVRDRDGDRDRDRERERERVILINPYNQTIIVQGGQNQDSSSISLGDYFIGPGLDLLLQHLAENDPNRYGTPPAQKEAIEAMPTVKIQETLQCSVCLDDFEIGTEAKEMPCKHKFHDGCIMPWLEMHSSCPVCRYQLPADESKLDTERSRNGSSQRESENDNHGNSEEGEADGRSPNSRRFSIPWPFNGLFSGSNSSSTSSGSQSGSSAQRDEN